MSYKIIIVTILLILPLSVGFVQAQHDVYSKIEHKAISRLKDLSFGNDNWQHLGKIKLDSVRVYSQSKQVELYFNAVLAYRPIREDVIQELKKEILYTLGRKFRGYNLNIYSPKQLLETYIPNAYRGSLGKDNSRYPKNHSSQVPLISNTSQPVYKHGLSNKHIAMWHSHGWYYEARLDRWEWQRARLFGSVEDLGTMSYVLPYLVPMLENAGANVLLPRERDYQTLQVTVDNDNSSKGTLQIINAIHKWQNEGKGFATYDTLFDNSNPFKQGTSLSILASTEDTAKVVYLPDIPADGMYAVYVSWSSSPQSVTQAYYTVYHTGGSTRFAVNQSIGGGTWQYLGHFMLRKGTNFDRGRVEISNRTESQGLVTADAVRFGGGMGRVARRSGSDYENNQWSLAGGSKAEQQSEIKIEKSIHTWKLSERPAFTEGARYYLQSAGIPASVYSLTEGKNDYNDDYQSRGEWVNYLSGQHQASFGDTLDHGMNIPVDLAFAFHTDAGITPNDSTIGTLAIYNTVHAGALFPSGRSKLASRDLSDLIQTQIVNDIRRQFDPRWTRRAMWDKAYSEAWRPKVPTMLLELLSHQNLADMRYSLDPRFRFAVSRAIYKAMLTYLHEQTGTPYIVQPLSPTHMSIEKLSAKRIRLSWQAQIDSLEPTAIAKQFMVYVRESDGGFDNGTLTNTAGFELELPKQGVVYSFKVAAVNEGGCSLPSEILSVCLQANNALPLLVVNGFNRISGPKWIDNTDFAGIAWWDDQGVPYLYDYTRVGNQYDFKRNSAWLDDDSPGWGASYSDNEGKPIPGNTFDNTYVHGQSIANVGHSFVSMSRDAFEQLQAKPSQYLALDLILGEQRSTPRYLDTNKTDFAVYTAEMIEALKSFAEAGKGLFVSGAYIGTDMIESNDSIAIRFAKEYLHYTWRTNHADKSGDVYRTDTAPIDFPASVKYNTVYNANTYTVEAPDAIEPSGKNAMTLFRYKSNNAGAGVLYKDKYTVVSLGFPFESINNQKERNELMKQVLDVITR